MTPVCRVCGSKEWVCQWRTEAPDQAICIDCCDHDDGYEYDRSAAHDCCVTCGGSAPPEHYDYDGSGED